MKLRLLIVTVMFLASCAPWQPLGSSYEPKSGSDYNRDLYECQREATLAGAGNKKSFHICDLDGNNSWSVAL